VPWKATEADLLAAARVLAGRTTFAERVRACFLDGFSITEPSVAYVCDSLHVSRTTLLRKLRAEGTRFQTPLAVTRRSLAMRYLTTSDLTSQQIAHLVGYVDPKAFQRAFKKWTGSTPRAMLQAHLVWPFAVCTVGSSKRVRVEPASDCFCLLADVE
jgi:AraC-like DNA-binding protein